MAPVRLHPETTADPQTLRWVADTVPLTAPTAAMAELVADGTLVDLEIDDGEIRTRLAPDRSWARDGDRVRSVLFQALSSVYDADPDALEKRIADLLRRDVAPYVSSHGGEIRIESLSDDGTLTVSLGGTCGHCSMQTSTLGNLVAGAVRSNFPEVREVRARRD